MAKKKPDGWYGFKVMCDLYNIGISNMSPPSQQEYCKRKDRRGKDRPRWEADKYFPPLKCNWDVCPKLKG